ncbi:MAG TPA: TonB-dependent receptor [Acidobacteriaceae bacterium]|nr:TonB-dependent receptor [Acidobacteriaceae bacterium]
MHKQFGPRDTHTTQFAKQALVVLFCIFGSMFTATASAQFLDQGAITGTVQDQSGAAIPGAQVTLLSPETGFKLTTKADGSGVYVFSPIKIGKYTLTTSAPGFKNAVQENITVSLGQRMNVSPKLSLGAVTETVTVTDAPPMLQSQDSSTGQTFTTQEINDTPLNGRNIVYLAQLAPGAVPSKGSRANGNGDFDANGMRAEQNNFVLDGVDNNSVTVDYLGGTSYLINPPPDALAEFKVSTANYSAEFGHSAGAVVNASIKAGTNRLHGDLWEYFRNDYLDAHDWVAAPSAKNSEYRQNQFGATLGGPVLKNHIFLFGDVQANRIVIAVPQGAITVPTALERQGDFSELLTPANFGGSVPQTLYEPQNNQVKMTCPALATPANPTGQNILCPNQIDPVAKAILNMYPMPNQSVHGIASQNYAFTLKQPVYTFQWDTRMDWNISPKDQMFARFSYLNQRGNNAAPLGPVLDGGTGNGSASVSGAQINYGNNFVLSETHIFSPNLVNEFRFAYDYGHFDILNPGFNINSAAALGLGGVPSGPDFPDNGGLPTTTISGGGGIAAFGAHAYRPEEEVENEYQILDNFSWNLGNHSVRVGFSYQSVRSDTLEPPSSHPAYTFNGSQTGSPGIANTGSGIADFLTDNMSNGSIGPSGKFNDAQDNISAYAQDDWKLTKKLTLNLGVRYEYFQPYKEMAGRMANFYTTSTGIGTGTGVYDIPAVDQGKITLNPAFLAVLAKDHITLQYDQNPRLTQQQNLNFAPRAGFAYTADTKTVFRGGFGIFYQGQQQGGAAVNLATNYPFVFSDNFPAPSCIKGSVSCANNGYTLEQGFSNAIAQGLTTYFATPGLVGQSPNLKTTYAMDYNLAFEQAFTNDFVATISYVGTVGRHLPIGINTNSTTVLLPSGSTQAFLPFPDFAGSSDVQYEGISSYNGLQTTLQKRISHGLNFSANYTWSHSLDDAANPLGGGIGGYRDASIIPIREDMTNSGWDTRHRFTFNGFYRLPFGRGEAHLNHSNYAVDALLGGWSTNVTYQLQSGNPFTVGTANQTNDTGGTQNAILIGNPFAPGGTHNSTNPSIPCPTSVRNKTNWYNPCAFANPLPASLITPFNTCPDPTIACQPNKYPYPTYITDEATAKLFLGGRSDQIYGPGIQRLDMSVFKHFHTFEEQYLEFRADAFNVLNTPIYNTPSTTNIGASGGLITTARSLQNYTPDSRFFQLSAKYVF